MTVDCSQPAEEAGPLAQAREARRRGWWLVLALVAITVALAFAGWPWMRAHLQSVAVLDLVGNKPVPKLLRRFVSEPIAVRDLELSLASGTVRARLYTPVRPKNAPALVVLHGVHHLGIDEPRLENFATTMAACGVQVLTPELPDIKDYQVGANSIATIGESAEWLTHEDGGRPVGVIGLSFSGGLSLLAAADPVYQGDIRFVMAVGAQDEMSRVAAYYRTGEDERPNGTEETLAPHEYGPLVLEYEHMGDFVPAQDVAPIRAVLRAHLYEDPAAERVALTSLSEEQKSEVKALMDTTLAATRTALERSDERHVNDMAAVSPHGRLATLKTPVYLLHGAGDNVIPSAETEWMAAELPRSSLKAELISPVLSHLNLDGAGPTIADQLRLVHFFAEVLHAAEVQ
ncbi:MAG TPA: alpha/beta hydrolase [Acidobacteriaceae bacterium]|nr:alpha/beta hydrolase [Acidobacteriaceae bacterium]